MTAKIDFTDATGAASLTNGKPVPGDRFANWTPSITPIGDAAARLSDGAVTMFRTRTDYGASFELPMIPSTGASSALTVAMRLVAHLMSGGQCSVTTGDAASSVYATCGLKPGTVPSLGMTDKRTIEYTLSVSLINLAGSPVAMVCRYAEQ
jgi:hypothetical protein